MLPHLPHDRNRYPVVVKNINESLMVSFFSFEENPVGSCRDILIKVIFVTSVNILDCLSLFSIDKN